MLIRLLKPHTHASRQYPAGAEIQLRDDKAQWLVGLKVAERVGDDPIVIDAPPPKEIKK